MEKLKVLDRNLVDFLLLNAYSMHAAGLMNGKAGVALALFEISRAYRDGRLEEHAFEVLQAALVDRSDCSFVNGKAGVGYVLDYLIRYRFIEADYDELFKEQQGEILNSVLNSGFESRNIRECIGMFCFIKRREVRGWGKETGMALQKLSKQINAYLKEFTVDVDADRMTFFRLAVGILFLQSHFGLQGEMMRTVNRLTEIIRLLKDRGYLCDHPWLGVLLEEYGKRSGVIEAEQWGKEILYSLAPNVIPEISDLRQLIDLWCAIQGKTEDFFIQKSVELSAFLSSPEEGKLKNSIPHQAFYVGLEHGISRLLLGKMARQGNEAERKRITEILSLTF